MALTMPIKDALAQWLGQQRWGDIVDVTPVAGGCICDNYAVTTQRGPRLFVKTAGSASAPARLFSCEAEGLEALRNTATLAVPQVYHVGTDFMVLEYIPPGTPGDSFWSQLARGLADLHSMAAVHFGFSSDNYCGTSPQPNPHCDDGYRFFAEQRLRFQGEMGLRTGLLNDRDRDQLERVIDRLPQWIPPQAPVLVHGDLWSGNIYCADSGEPVLIDPACYWGWRETDIAMTRLFGALPAQFYHSYQQCLPMPPGWEQRMALYNLYHLLNHLNLFGEGYLSQVRSTLAHYQ